MCRMIFADGSVPNASSSRAWYSSSATAASTMRARRIEHGELPRMRRDADERAERRPGAAKSSANSPHQRSRFTGCDANGIRLLVMRYSRIRRRSRKSMDGRARRGSPRISRASAAAWRSSADRCGSSRCSRSARMRQNQAARACFSSGGGKRDANGGWPCTVSMAMPRGWPRRSGCHRGSPNVLASCSGRVVVASHNDVDGLSALVVVTRALARTGRQHHAAARARGEHVHQDALRIRIGALDPDRLIVLDTWAAVRGHPAGSCRRSSSITTTPRAACPRARCSSPVAAARPVAPSSVLAFVICRDLADGRDRWPGSPRWARSPTSEPRPRSGSCSGSEARGAAVVEGGVAAQCSQASAGG